MKVGIIIPDRGDRPEFLKNCLRMISSQVLDDGKLDILVMDYKPESEEVDITQRYRRGYEKLSDRGVDIIAFIENDDWYSPVYLQTMLSEWDKARTDLFGTNYTVYYHLKMKKYFKAEHHQRSCSMNTLIKPNLIFEWPKDNEPYTDAGLWGLEGWSKRLYAPKKIISVAMKHGEGLCGGEFHNNRLERYINDDNGFLQNTLDEASFEFYKNIFYEAK